MNEDGVAEGHSHRPNEQTVGARCALTPSLNFLSEKYEAHHPSPQLHAGSAGVITPGALDFIPYFSEHIGKENFTHSTGPLSEPVEVNSLNRKHPQRSSAKTGKKSLTTAITFSSHDQIRKVMEKNTHLTCHMAESRAIKISPGLPGGSSRG